MNATEQAYRDRQAAIKLVLRTIKHPMMIHCVPDREAAIRAAVQFRMTAVDLLNAAHNIFEQPGIEG